MPRAVAAGACRRFRPTPRFVEHVAADGLCGRFCVVPAGKGRRMPSRKRIETIPMDQRLFVRSTR